MNKQNSNRSHNQIGIQQPVFKTNQFQNYHPINNQSLHNPDFNDFSPLMKMIDTGVKNPKIIVKRNCRGFGFVIRAIKVFYGDSDFYTIQHLVVQIDQQGPAYSSGLKINDIITHVNDEVVCGKMHSEIVKLMMASFNNTVYLKTVPFNQTNIKTGGRKRSFSGNRFVGVCTPLYTQQLNYNITPNDLGNQRALANSFMMQSFQNCYPVENHMFCNSMLSGYNLVSNPSTRNSSTSSLVSTSSRRSLGTNVNEFHPQINGGLLQTTYQPQSFVPNLVPPQVVHPMHVKNSQVFIAPCQPVAQERKKVPCLRRKLSERYANANKSELQRQFQLQNQNQIQHSSSSSSSSSSLNNSLNLKQRTSFSPKLNQTALTLSKKKNEESFKKVEKKFK